MGRAYVSHNVIPESKLEALGAAVNPRPPASAAPPKTRGIEPGVRHGCFETRPMMSASGPRKRDSSAQLLGALLHFGIAVEGEGNHKCSDEAPSAPPPPPTPPARTCPAPAQLCPIEALSCFPGAFIRVLKPPTTSSHGDSMELDTKTADTSTTKRADPAGPLDVC